MDILVALLALFRRFFEVHIHELGFHVRRLVAVDAGNRSMRARQWKRRRAVVKSVQFFPGLRGVTGLAAHLLSVLSDLVHYLLELTLLQRLLTGRSTLF